MFIKGPDDFMSVSIPMKVSLMLLKKTGREKVERGIQIPYSGRGCLGFVQHKTILKLAGDMKPCLECMSSGI